MKKLTLITAASAFLFLVSCSSDTNTDATTAAAGEHGHAHDEKTENDHDVAVGKVVVETPAFTTVDASFKSEVAKLLNQYLPVKDALVASDAPAAQKAASELLATANALPVGSLQDAEQKTFAAQQHEKIKNTASGIANASDISTQRQQLQDLSEAVYALTKAFGATDQKLYYQHCPMALNDKGGYWLSNNKEIRNPYFGDKMLACGSNEEVLN